MLINVPTVPLKLQAFPQDKGLEKPKARELSAMAGEGSQRGRAG